MKLVAIGIAVTLLLLACSFGGHARVAPHVQSLYKNIEAKQRSVGDIWSNCGEFMHASKTCPHWHLLLEL